MKKYRTYIYVVIIIAIGVGIWKFTSTPEEPDYELGAVERATLVQEVSVTGKVVSAEQRTLSFERAGKVSRVLLGIGDVAEAGDALVSLDTSEILAQIKQAEAVLDAEKSVLTELRAGTRDEEVQVALTAVENAKRNLVAAQTNLQTTKEKTEADLLSLYDGTVTALQSAVVDAKNALISLAEIQEAHFDNFSQQGTDIAQKKAAVVASLLGEESSGYWEAEFISDLNGGLFGDVRALDDGLDTEQVDVYLMNTIEGLTLLRDALNSVPIVPEMTATEKTTLTSEKNSISTEITALSGKEQSISVQRVLNESTINAAETTVTTAENAIAGAESQLALTQSGSTAATVATQEARVRAQEATVDLYQAQLGKYTLWAPIDGFVTDQNAEVGVVVTAGMPIVSIQSEGTYEIEAFIPEADITKVAITDIAHVTLDAYSDDTVLTAEVSDIDPAETIIEGVPTYKVTLQIIEGGALVKSGMTANIDVVTETKRNVLMVPTRAVITEEGERFVRGIDALGEIIMLPVSVGLRSSDGRIEITEGLEENQEIITFMGR